MEFMERFFSGYARSSSLNVVVMNKSVKKTLLIVLRKTHAIHKKNANIVAVNIINQSFIL